MPISNASSRSLAFIGIIPLEPTPTGMWSKSDWKEFKNIYRYTLGKALQTLNQTVRAEKEVEHNLFWDRGGNMSIVSAQTILFWIWKFESIQIVAEIFQFFT